MRGSDAPKRIGPACNSRRCSVRMVNLEIGWLPWMMTGCLEQYDIWLSWCRPPIQRIPKESIKGRRVINWLPECITLSFFKDNISSRKWACWINLSQYCSAYISSQAERNLLPSQQLWMNWNIQAVIRFNVVKFEQWLSGTIGDLLEEFTVCRENFLFFSRNVIRRNRKLLRPIIWCFLQPIWSMPPKRECFNKSEGNNPLDAQSAGFSFPLTCFNFSGGIRSMMLEILFPIYMP